MPWPSGWYMASSHNFPSCEQERAGAVPPRRSRQGGAVCRQQGSPHAHVFTYCVLFCKQTWELLFVSIWEHAWMLEEKSGGS